MTFPSLLHLARNALDETSLYIGPNPTDLKIILRPGYRIPPTLFHAYQGILIPTGNGSKHENHTAIAVYVPLLHSEYIASSHV